jgi:hypothetical protein
MGARAEEQAQRTLRVESVHDGSREVVVRRRPPLRAAESHLVFGPGLRVQAVDAHERVVVTANAEGLRPGTQHLDLAGSVRLHPDSGVGLAHVPEDGP